MKEKLGIALVMAAMFQFSNLNAAPIDREIAILASEQSQSEQQPKAEEKVDTPTPKTKKELEAEEKRLREEKRAEEKRLKAEKEAARKKIEEGKREQIPISNDKNGVRRNNNTRLSNAEDNSVTSPSTATENSVATPKVENPVVTTKPVTPVEKPVVKPQVEKPVTPTKPVENPIATTPNNISNIPQELPLQSSSPADKNVGMPNPIKSYSSFEEVADVVGFTPLYIPKKSGYTITDIMSIDNRVAEIRYGRRWEPEVSLAVRTYKRAPNEELKDISGVQGAKWRADESSGSTVYLAKISNDNHAAAWAVGDFTFSAYVENLSFAAFYALVIEELVDLSNHYYVA